MFDEKNDGLTVLKTLTDTVADSVNGYRDAVQHLDSEQYRTTFTQLADDRSQALSNLQSAVESRGGSADSDGTTLGHLHQSWLDFKASFSTRDDKAVINEVERGEDYLKAKFETALKSDTLDSDTRSIVETAFASVRQGHDTVSGLKKSLESAVS